MAAILNENLEWHRIAADHPDVSRAFRGVPVKKLVPPGSMLCRLTTLELTRQGIRGIEVLVKGTEIFSSPWWMDWDVVVAMLLRFKRAKVPPTEIIRGQMAVTLTMSLKLDGLAQILLTKPVYAWKGVARHQDDETRCLTYLGGGEQYYLPGLAPPKSCSSNFARLHAFTRTDSLESVI